MKMNSPNHASLPASRPDLALDLALHLAPRLHHENNHGDDEEGGDQHDPAFEDVFVQMSAGDDDGYADAAKKSRGQRRIHGLAQFLPPDLGQVGQGDADNQGRLDPFAERDDESLKHLMGAL